MAGIAKRVVLKAVEKLHVNQPLKLERDLGATAPSKAMEARGAI